MLEFTEKDCERIIPRNKKSKIERHLQNAEATLEKLIWQNNDRLS